MTNKHYIALELDKVLELLAEKTTSEATAARARGLIPYSDFGKLFSFRLPEKALAQLERASEAYLLAQVERMLPALDFYKGTISPNT